MVPDSGTNADCKKRQSRHQRAFLLHLVHTLLNSGHVCLAAFFALFDGRHVFEYPDEIQIWLIGTMSTTVWLSNRHGRAFWKNTRVLYTPEFAALVDSGMDGRANGFVADWLKSIGVGDTSDSSGD